MQIGSFGSVVFQIDQENFLTIKAMSREKTSKWEEAQILNDLSFLEYRGRDLTTISLDIQLVESLGTKIAQTLTELNKILENGEYHYLVIGQSLIGENPFVLESISENFEKHQGDFKYVEVSISLKEYRDNGKSIRQLNEEKSKKNNVETDSEEEVIQKQLNIISGGGGKLG